MGTEPLVDRFEIQDLLCRFQESFDRHDWPAMAECLTDEIFTDYSSFRNAGPQVQSRNEYVELRKAALSALRTQHNFLNLRVVVAGDHATARCNYVIHRFAPNFSGEVGGFFHSYGTYDFRFVRTAAGWRISGITQTLLANHGNPELHTGAATHSRNA